jgi:transposase
MAARLRADRTTEGVAHEFAPSARAIRNWVRRVDRDEGRREDGLTSAEREETRWLRREEKQLSLKREIPAKAAAWFAREIDSIPPAPSSS